MNRKYAVHPGAYELGENEKFYSDMEAKGWRLKKRGAYLSRFERTAPSSARYRVEVFQPDAWAAKDLPEEQKAVFEDCGWEYVCPACPCTFSGLRRAATPRNSTMTPPSRRRH